ncbi:MAG: aminomethyl-transferring glycine dehydrogenase subunit GcvPB [Trueperaceae bacterium]|nr:aminomethyl-transferring glycine dehydrogenase subunit GcvPB [Trueperaceae bacterium]
MSEHDAPLLFERSRAGRRAARPPQVDGPSMEALLGADALREAPPRLPEVSELDLVRHFTQLAHRQFSIDGNVYPLGSCTMKYNPKVHEDAAALFDDLHPYQDPEGAQGVLSLLWSLKQDLATLTGMDEVSLQPAAGAHGELTGILMIRAYHRARGEDAQRRIVLVPDAAHGTNPATAGMVGYRVVEVPTGPDGEMDVGAFEAALSPEVAAVMLTNPSTIGIFESQIVRIAEAAHAVGAQLYYDGANLNAIVGKARPGDMGFDVVHLNLHKTFTTPHGGGGPGTGPIGVHDHLAPFLPRPLIVREGDRYRLEEDRPGSIGRMRSFYGNVGNLVRAYAYIRSLGADGLRNVADMAVLNANYLRVRMGEHGCTAAYDRTCMHEFVARPPAGVRTLDVAKALLDEGMHPMTVYFPLIVKEAMMVEPTETESLETLDAYAEAIGRILDRAAEDPDALAGAPHHTPVRRLDEVAAARRPVLRWSPETHEEVPD